MLFRKTNGFSKFNIFPVWKQCRCPFSIFFFYINNKILRSVRQTNIYMLGPFVSIFLFRNNFFLSFKGEDYNTFFVLLLYFLFVKFFPIPCFITCRPSFVPGCPCFIPCCPSFVPGCPCFIPGCPSFSPGCHYFIPCSPSFVPGCPCFTLAVDRMETSNYRWNNNSKNRAHSDVLENIKR